MHAYSGSGGPAKTQPVEPQGVAAGDPVLTVERQEFGQRLLLPAIEHVALIFGDDQRQTGNLCRKIAQFDAAKIGEGNVAASVRLAAPPIDLRLDLPHLLIGDDEEIA